MEKKTKSSQNKLKNKISTIQLVVLIVSLNISLMIYFMEIMTYWLVVQSQPVASIQDSQQFQDYAESFKSKQSQFSIPFKQQKPQQLSAQKKKEDKNQSELQKSKQIVEDKSKQYNELIRQSRKNEVKILQNTNTEEYINISIVLDKNPTFSQLPFCIIIHESQKLRSQIFQSLKKQKYTNFRTIQLIKNRKIDNIQLNSYYGILKLLEESQCGEKDIILAVSSPLKEGCLKKINENFQKYHTYIIYSSFNVGNEQYYQLYAVYRKVFSMLISNDFDQTNNLFLRAENYKIIVKGLLELCRRRNLKMFSQQLFQDRLGSFSFLNYKFAQLMEYNRTQFQALWRINQQKIEDQQLDETVWELFQNRQLQETTKIKMAAQYRQLPYLPDNHALAQRERINMHNKYQINNYTDQLPMCIVMPTYNNVAGRRYEKVLRSIIQQQYSNYHVVLVDDLSIDGTMQKSIQLLQQLDFGYANKFHFVQSLQKNWATYNIVLGIYNYCGKNDIVVRVDGDDEIIGKQAFKFFNAIYHQKPQKWVIFASYYMKNYLTPQKVEQKYSQVIVNEKGERTGVHYFTHLKSFRAPLMRYLTLKDHTTENGQWLKVMQDDAFQYVAAELARQDRIEHIYQILYFYSTDYDKSTNQKMLYIYQIYNQFRNRRPYQRLQSLDPNYKNQQIQNILKNDQGVRYQQVRLNFKIGD